jgi:hypothetical protein
VRLPAVHEIRALAPRLGPPGVAAARRAQEQADRTARRRAPKAPLPRSSAVRAVRPSLFLFPPDVIPIARDRIGAEHGHVGKHVRMPSYQFGHDSVCDVVDRGRGAVVTLGCDAGVEHDLQQHVPEFLAEGLLIDRLEGPREPRTVPRADAVRARHGSGERPTGGRCAAGPWWPRGRSGARPADQPNRARAWPRRAAPRSSRAGEAKRPSRPDAGSAIASSIVSAAWPKDPDTFEGRQRRMTGRQHDAS